MAKYARGSDVTFSATYKDSNLDPIIPIDLNYYPQTTVIGPDGLSLANGVATTHPTLPGIWIWIWSVPEGIVLGDGWSIVWTVLDTNNESHVQTFGFEIYDQIEAQEAVDRDGSYLTMYGKSERVLFRSAINPYDLTLEIYSPNDPLGDTTPGIPWQSYTKAQLTEVYADGYYNFYVDTPVIVDYVGTWLVVWSCRESLLSRMDQTVQHIRVPASSFWYLLPYVRGLLDKLGKVQNTALSYTDSELYTYCERGCDLINSVNPRTLWSPRDMPAEIWSWWALATGIWALTSMDLLEIEIGHDFAGQQVQLTYDKHSKLSEVISRWETMLYEKFQPMKVAMYRQASGPGVVSVRPYRLNFHNRVYRAGGANAPLANLSSLIGLLGLTV